MERLGMGVRKLGFGQTGGGAARGAAPKAMGFGSTSKPAVDGEYLSYQSRIPPREANEPQDSEQFARQKFGAQKGISSDEFFGRESFDPSAQAEARR